MMGIRAAATAAALLLAAGQAGAVRLRSGGRAPAPAGAAGMRRDYKLQLENFQNVQYFGQFTAGGQTMPVIYDTGSFEIIVLSTRCKKCQSAVHIYNPKTSKTFSEGDKLVAEHVFGSGPVLSQKGVETCAVGPVGSPLQAPGMPFWQVLDHQIDVWDKYSQFSGIVGLGHSAHTPEMETQNASKKLPKDVVLLERLGVNSFSVCLERGTGTPPGWIAMGPTVERASTSKAYRHVPVIGEIHWGVQMRQLKAGGQESFDACSPSCAAIIDSGTSLIAAPGKAMKALEPIFASIKKDCSNLDKLPDLTFRLGDEDFVLPPAIYVMQLTYYEPKPQNVWENLFKPPELQAVTECVPSFMQMDKKTPNYGPVWILGMPFLRYYHTTFTRKPKGVQIAYADSKCEPTATPPSIFARIGGSGNASHLTRVSSGTPHFAAGAASAGSGAQATRVSLPEGANLEHPVVRMPAWALDKTREEIEL